MEEQKGGDLKTVSVRVSDEELKSLSRTRRARRPRRSLAALREPRADVEVPAFVQKVEAPVAPTTAALPAVATKPRILFTKKNRVTKDPPVIARGLAKKPVLVIATKEPAKEPTKELTGTPVHGTEAEKTQAKKKTRRFKVRKLRMTLNARGSASKTAATRVATMSITDVRAQLMAAGLLKGKTRTPPAVLRGMLTEWLQLHAGA